MHDFKSKFVASFGDEQIYLRESTIKIKKGIMSDNQSCDRNNVNIRRLAFISRIKS